MSCRLLLVLMALLGSFGAVGISSRANASATVPAGPSATLVSVSSTATRYAAPAPPEISAAAVYVLDATVGTELYAINADDRRAPASLTKVATALVVLELADLDEMVTIEPGDLADESESRVGLEAGDKLSVRDLLYGLLIPSGNDAARALARHVGESLPSNNDPTEAFVAEMNRLPEAVGLSNTRFANPTGLDQDNHFSTARDLALLTAQAMDDPLFAEIVGSPDATLPSQVRPDGYPIATTNDLLLDGTVIGVKTGTTEQAGGCLIAAVDIADNVVISVVLGSPVETAEDDTTESPARFADTRSILDAMQTDYQWLDPLQLDAMGGLGEELGVWQAELPDGTAIVVPSDRADELRYRLLLGPAAEQDGAVGRVLFYVGDALLSEQSVVQAA